MLLSNELKRLLDLIDDHASVAYHDDSVFGELVYEVGFEFRLLDLLLHLGLISGQLLELVLDSPHSIGLFGSSLCFSIYLGLGASALVGLF